MQYSSLCNVVQEGVNILFQVECVAAKEGLVTVMFLYTDKRRVGNSPYLYTAYIGWLRNAHFAALELFDVDPSPENTVTSISRRIQSQKLWIFCG